MGETRLISDDELLGAIEADLVGDAETTRAATGAAAELFTRGFGAYADKQAKDEKAAADKKAKEAADAMAKAYGDAVKAAQDARTAALIAAARAKGEADPSGPLHIAAIQAEADAVRAESKAAALAGSAGAMARYSGSSGNFLTKHFGPLPVWGWGVVGVTGGVVVWGVVKLLSSKKGRR